MVDNVAYKQHMPIKRSNGLDQLSASEQIADLRELVLILKNYESEISDMVDYPNELKTEFEIIWSNVSNAEDLKEPISTLTGIKDMFEKFMTKFNERLSEYSLTIVMPEIISVDYVDKHKFSIRGNPDQLSDTLEKFKRNASIFIKWIYKTISSMETNISNIGDTPYSVEDKQYGDFYDRYIDVLLKAAVTLSVCRNNIKASIQYIETNAIPQYIQFDKEQAALTKEIMKQEGNRITNSQQVQSSLNSHGFTYTPKRPLPTSIEHPKQVGVHVRTPLSGIFDKKGNDASGSNVSANDFKYTPKAKKATQPKVEIDPVTAKIKSIVDRAIAQLGLEE